VLKGNKTLQSIKLCSDEISNLGALQLATLMASGDCFCRQIAFSNNNLINADGLKQVQDTLRFSDFEEVGILAFRKRGVERRGAQQAAAIAAPPESVAIRSVSIQSKRLLVFGLAAIALGLGAAGLFLASRQKKDSAWSFGIRKDT